MLWCSFLSLCANEEERRGGRQYLVLFAGADLNRIFLPSVNLLFPANADVTYDFYLFHASFFHFLNLRKLFGAAAVSLQEEIYGNELFQSYLEAEKCDWFVYLLPLSDLCNWN